MKFDIVLGGYHNRAGAKSRGTRAAKATGMPVANLPYLTYLVRYHAAHA